MYGGKFGFTKSIGLACSGKEIYHFCFLYKAPGGGVCSEGRFNGGFFSHYDFVGLSRGAYFRNFTVY